MYFHGISLTTKLYTKQQQKKFFKAVLGNIFSLTTSVVPNMSSLSLLLFPRVVCGAGWYECE